MIRPLIYLNGLIGFEDEGSEWSASQDIRKLLLHLTKDKGNGKKFGKHRKLRLFNVACCQRVMQLMPDDYCRQAVVVAERYADGLASQVELSAAADQIFQLMRSPSSWSAQMAAFHVAANRYKDASSWTRMVVQKAIDGGQIGFQNEGHFQVGILKDIFGNPFRRVNFNLSWRSPTSLALATGIYLEKAFDRLPILADSLLDAGCENDDILNHFRQPGEHCRGCWALDLVLGKS